MSNIKDVEDKKSNLGLLIFGIIGGLLVISVIGFILYKRRGKKKINNSLDTDETII